MTDDANLHGTLDASVWAAEFCKRWPSALCQIAGKEGVFDGTDFEATMIGWFANAIMTGYDKALAASPEVQALIREAEARVMRISAGLFPGGYDANFAKIEAAIRETKP